MMMDILLFFLVALLPGLCVLWLLSADWATRRDFRSGSSIGLAVPASFALSVSLISIIGWIGFFLHWNFYTVRFVFLIVVGILTLASIYKLWQRKWFPSFRPIENLSLVSSFKTWDYAFGLLIVAVLLAAIYGGIWYSHTADSLNHFAAVRSLIKFNNPVPMQIYWPFPVEGMDATFGTWHLVLAIFVSLTKLGIPEMWLLVTIVVAPLLVWTFAAFAYELTQNKGAALIAGLLYVIVGLSGDFRMAAYPNRMGQIVLWLAFLFMLQAVKAFSQTEKRSGTVFLGIAALFAWTASAIHMQYGPVLLGLTLAFAAIAIFFSLVWKIKNRQKPTGTQSMPLRVIVWVAAVILVAGSVSFAVRTSYTISEKTPLVAQTTGTDEAPDTWQGVAEDLSQWFGGLGLSVTAASLLSLLLLYRTHGEKPGLYLILASIFIVPGFLIFSALLIGRGGLMFSTFMRLSVLIPPFLIIGWSWILSISISTISAILNNYNDRRLPSLLFAVSVPVISVFPIISQMTDPNGGFVSLYFPGSSYTYSVAQSRDFSLLDTRKDAIEALNTIPTGKRIVADEGVAYEMAGLTDGWFLGLPSQHVPMQEKKFNVSAYRDIRSFLSGKLNDGEMVKVLLYQDVDYVYVDRERYNGAALWDRLHILPVLEEVAEGPVWRLYRFVPEKARTYIALEKEIRTEGDFLNKLALLRQLQQLFSSQERYAAALAQELPLDETVVADFVAQGQNFLRTPEAGVTVNLVEELDEATVVSEDANSIYRTAFIINQQPRGVIFQHPTSKLIFDAQIPQNNTLDFSIALDPVVWEIGKGDGVEFLISIETEQSTTLAFDEYIDPKNVKNDRRWFNYSLDLTDFGGQNVKIILETRAGLQDDARFDWAGWGEPRLRSQVVYDFNKNWDSLIIESSPEAEVKQVMYDIGGEKRLTIFQHPGSRIMDRVTLPLNPELRFGLGIDPAVWNTGQSDGIQYRVYVQYPGEQKKYLVFDRFVSLEEQLPEQDWEDINVGLSQFGGDTVDIIFETLPGPNNDSAFDWGGWGAPYIVNREE